MSGGSDASYGRKASMSLNPIAEQDEDESIELTDQSKIEDLNASVEESKDDSLLVKEKVVEEKDLTG